MPIPAIEPAPPALPADAEALRAELRCLLQHLAIAPARRLAAEPFIRGCTDSARLREWVALTVTECGRWEEQILAGESAPGSGHYSRK